MVVYKSTIEEIKLKNHKGELKKVKITSSKDMCEYMRAIFDEETLEVSEQFMVIFLNNSMNTIGWYKASQGGITGTIVDVRLVLKAAINCYATAMIIAHNHPSGRTFPSDQDNNITLKIKEASKMLDINLMDHLILTTDSYYSYADEGKI